MNNEFKGDESSGNGKCCSDESVSNGRQTNGRFGSGNQFSKGNKRQDRFRGLFEKCVTDSDFTAVIKSLINQAIGGDVPAAKLILERCMGKEVETVKLENEPQGRVVLYLPQNNRQPNLASAPFTSES